MKSLAYLEEEIKGHINPKERLFTIQSSCVTVSYCVLLQQVHHIDVGDASLLLHYRVTVCHLPTAWASWNMEEEVTS